MGSESRRVARWAIALLSVVALDGGIASAAIQTSLKDPTQIPYSWSDFGNGLNISRSFYAWFDRCATRWSFRARASIPFW